MAQEPLQLSDLLMDLQDRVSGMLEDVHRSSGGVSDPRGPSGGGPRVRNVQFRMPRRLACIVGLSLVSATDFSINTVDRETGRPTRSMTFDSLAESPQVTPFAVVLPLHFVIWRGT